MAVVESTLVVDYGDGVQPNVYKGADARTFWRERYGPQGTDKGVLERVGILGTVGVFAEETARGLWEHYYGPTGTDRAEIVQIRGVFGSDRTVLVVLGSVK